MVISSHQNASVTLPFFSLNLAATLTVSFSIQLMLLKQLSGNSNSFTERVPFCSIPTAGIVFILSECVHVLVKAEKSIEEDVVIFERTHLLSVREMFSAVCMST